MKWENGVEALLKAWSPPSRLNDLSPAATFIAYNYNTPVDVHAFEREAKRILREVEAECGWMYETIHTDGRTERHHQLYSLERCLYLPRLHEGSSVFWDAAVDHEAGKVRDEFPVHMRAMLTKRRMERAWGEQIRQRPSRRIRQAKQCGAY
jgi:hypothetical protein